MLIETRLVRRERGLIIRACARGIIGRNTHITGALRGFIGGIKSPTFGITYVSGSVGSNGWERTASSWGSRSSIAIPWCVSLVVRTLLRPHMRGRTHIGLLRLAIVGAYKATPVVRGVQVLTTYAGPARASRAIIRASIRGRARLKVPVLRRLL